MSEYNVRVIDPRTKRIVTHMSICESRLYTGLDGQKMFAFDSRQKLPVISLEKVSEKYLKAEAAYFNQFGTAGE